MEHALISQSGEWHVAPFATCAPLTSALQLPFVDVVIYSFHYLLDPKVAEQVSKDMSKDSIVVFHEANNIGEAHLSLSRRLRAHILNR